MKKPAPRGQFSTVSLPTPGGMGYSRRPPPKTGGVPTKTGPKTRKNDRFFEFSGPPGDPPETGPKPGFFKKTPIFSKNRPRTARNRPPDGPDRPETGVSPPCALETGPKQGISCPHLRGGWDRQCAAGAALPVQLGGELGEQLAQ